MFQLVKFPLVTVPTSNSANLKQFEIEIIIPTLSYRSNSILSFYSLQSFRFLLLLLLSIGFALPPSSSLLPSPLHSPAQVRPQMNLSLPFASPRHSSPCTPLCIAGGVTKLRHSCNTHNEIKVLLVLQLQHG